jgi:hypothetical protein
MSELMNPRIPGLGLAPTVAPDISARRREAMMRSAMSDEHASRQDAAGTSSLLDVLRVRVRAGRAGLASAERPGASRPNRPAARA